MESSRAKRSVIPILLPKTEKEKAKFHKWPWGVQLPDSLRMPSPELLHLFRKLTAHLKSVRLLELEKPPLAVIVSKMLPDNRYEVQLHIPPGLTDDSDLCDDLHHAITTFIDCSCPCAASVRLPFARGVGSIIVHLHPKAVKSLDTVLFSVIRIARLLQIADGDIKRLPGILRDPVLAAGLMKLVGAYHFDGSPGKVLMRPTAGHIRLMDSEALAKHLADAGHIDLAMIVLTGTLRNGDFYAKGKLGPTFVSYLVTHDLLSNEQDFGGALTIVEDLLCNVSRVLPHWNALITACQPLAAHLANKSMPEAAFDLVTQMYLPFERADTKRLEYMDVMEAIVDSPVLSIELAERVLDLLNSKDSPFTFELARKLEVKLAGLIAVPSLGQGSPHAKLSFPFTYGHRDGTTVIIPGSDFVPALHGPEMIEYAESLVRGSPDPELLRLFCWPVLEFLMPYLKDLPAEVTRGVLTLTTTVVIDMTKRELSSPILAGPVTPTIQRMQRFIEAGLLHGVFNVLPVLDRQQAFNVVAWVHQSRTTLFPSLSKQVFDAVLAPVLEISGVTVVELDAHRVDARAAKAATMQSALAPAAEQLLALFRSGRASGKLELLRAVLQCWKTLTGASDVECLALRLHHGRFIAPEVAIRLVQEARDELKKCLASPTLEVEAALELHGELIDFIVHVTLQHGAEVGWATQVLADMSSGSSPLCKFEPNAAAWISAGRIEILAKSGNLRADECLMILSECASLRGVTVDRRVATIFQNGIDALVHEASPEQGPWTVAQLWPPLKRALQALMILESVPAVTGPDRTRVRVNGRTLVDLVFKTLYALDEEVDLEVDIPKVASALLAEVLRVDENVVLVFLSDFLNSNAILRDYPLLGLSLCDEAVARYRALNRPDVASRVHAMALAHMPHEWHLQDLTREILKDL